MKNDLLIVGNSGKQSSTNNPISAQTSPTENENFDDTRESEFEPTAVSYEVDGKTLRFRMMIRAVFGNFN